MGFSAVVQGLALDQQGELQRRAFMKCDVTQELLEGAAVAFFSHSLVAERAAAEVKRREGRNITLLGNVSLDLLCRRFNKRRVETAEPVDAAEEVLRKLERSSWQAIAWEKSDVFPQGVRSTVDAPLRYRNSNSLLFSRGSQTSWPATSGHRTSWPATSGSRTTSLPATGGSRNAWPAKGGSQISLSSTSGSQASLPATGGSARRRSLSNIASPSTTRSRSRPSRTVDLQQKKACNAERRMRIESARSHLGMVTAQTADLPCTI